MSRHLARDFYLSSYYTGRTLANGKRETKTGLFIIGVGCVMSLPARLSGYKMPTVREARIIYQGK